jgi:uncharacterized membrane protein YhdT
MFPLFQWLENSGIGATIRGSMVLFPIVEAMHLVALGLFGAAVLLVDMRLIGFGLTSRPVAELEREARPWLIASLTALVVSGFLLFLSESIKCYYSVPFWVKMTCLLSALVFTFTVRRRVAAANGTPPAPLSGKMTALISLTLWAGVLWGGRWIGFS